MGMSHLVYPGAHHTRFHHALGSMHLMQKAVEVLRFKNVDISEEEETSLYIAILLHDIGHGPFSHAMEDSIVQGISHEKLSARFMAVLNEEFDDNLNLAIQIFQGEYHRPFMCQLISSQIDMDRSDYLKRDSFYTGVSEGNINSDRLITMLNVRDNHLVVEEKGIYSLEKFLVARRFMYWQVYLHKTSLAAEQILIRALKRAKYLVRSGMHLPCGQNLEFFLKNDVNEKNLDPLTLERFSKLDDYDVISALKDWQESEDFVLSNLCRMIINRNLPKIKLKKQKASREKIKYYINKLVEQQNITEEEAKYFVFEGYITNQAYHRDKQEIKILRKNGRVVDISRVSDQIVQQSLTEPSVKHYYCYPKEIN